MIFQAVQREPFIDGDQDCEDDEELTKRTDAIPRTGVDDDEGDDAVED